MERKEIAVWEIDINKHSSKTLSPLSLDSEESLEDLLASDISLLERELLVIGRQLTTPSGDLDLLCVANNGNIVVIELKKDRVPRDAIAQAIDYTSQISTMDEDRFKNFVEEGIRKGENGYPQFEVLYDFIKNWEPDFDFSKLNQSQRIIVAGHRLDSQTEKMIAWLSANGIEINAYEFPFFKTGDKTILVRRIIISSERVESDRAKISKYIPLTETELFEMASNIDQIEQIKLIRDLIRSILVKDYGKFYEIKTRSTFSYNLDCSKHSEEWKNKYPNFIAIKCDEPYVYFYRKRCEKLMNKSLSELENKYGIPEESDEVFLTIKQGENTDETKKIIVELQKFFE